MPCIWRRMVNHSGSYCSRGVHTCCCTNGKHCGRSAVIAFGHHWGSTWRGQHGRAVESERLSWQGAERSRAGDGSLGQVHLPSLTGLLSIIQRTLSWGKGGKRARSSWHVLFIVARRIGVNLVGLCLLLCGQALPLCLGDCRGLPADTLALLTSTSLMRAVSSPHLHPFLLSIVPHTQALIAGSVFGTMVGWEKLSFLKLASAREASTVYGYQKIQFALNVLGVAFTALAAGAMGSQLMRLGLVGTSEFLSVVTALMAGSALSVMVCNAITVHGLGNGVGFLYLAAISDEMSQDWQVLVAQSLTTAQVLQAAVVIVAVVAATAAVNTLSYPVPLKHTNVALASQQGEVLPELQPKVAIQIAPHCTMVLIGIAVLRSVLSGCTPSWFWSISPLMLALLVPVLSSLDVKTTAASLRQMIQSLELMLPGVAPGQATEDVLFKMLLMLRLLGSLALLGLLALSLTVDAAMLRIAGVRISIMQLLIVISHITTMYYVMTRALEESATVRKMQSHFQMFV